MKLIGKRKLRVRALWYDKDNGWNSGMQVIAWDYMPEPYVPGDRVIYDGYKELELLERQRQFEDKIRAAMSEKAERFKNEVLHGERNDGNDRSVVESERNERKHGSCKTE